MEAFCTTFSSAPDADGGSLRALSCLSWTAASGGVAKTESKAMVGGAAPTLGGALTAQPNVKRSGYETAVAVVCSRDGSGAGFNSERPGLRRWTSGRARAVPCAPMPLPRAC